MLGTPAATPQLAISVVVPTHNRPKGFAELLAALSNQALERERFEVIVVDDGSQPAVTVASQGLRVRVIRHERALGPATARNVGWRAAKAPLVAFVDDDCAPVPGWLSALVDTAEGAEENLIVQGPVAPAPEQVGLLNPLSHTMRLDGPSRLFVTCNIAFSKSLLDRLGGFDERFKRACGEDVELGARALQAGGRMLWSDGALVYHEVRPGNLTGALRQTMKWTDSVLAVSMHPELRDLLTARIFWKPTHPLLLLAVAGIGTRRAPVAAVAAVPYIRHYRREHGGSTRRMTRWLAVHFAVDACEIATALVGSARHRTLMI